jgi:hypothetical protein
VCTAGIDLNKKSWIRIFPIRFFDLPFPQRFKKYDVIEVEVEPTRDKFTRKESHKANDSSLKIIGNVDTSNNWGERKKILLPLARKSVEELEMEYDSDHTSMGILKPKRILEFKITPIERCRDWEKDLVLGIQQTLAGDYKSPLDKIPYKFSYVFECNDPTCVKPHDLMIEDWEICQLFRSERERLGEAAALEKVTTKYYDEFTKEKELLFVLGTESNWNNWLVISVFYPKKEASFSLQQ